MNEWKAYKVGTPSTYPNWTNPDCQPFSWVGHASHIDSALNIVREGQLRQGLVFDESKLNTSRILVTWLSPNHWVPGYRYGGVKFDFDFISIAQGMRYYWVEAITKYSPPACRILITDLDRSNILPPYDPTSTDGPWWFDTKTNTNYYNGNYCLEFMIETTIPLSAACQISFVDHHKQYCSVHRYNPIMCKELGMPSGLYGEKFISKACAQNINLSRANSIINPAYFKHALQYILKSVRSHIIFSGSMMSTDPMATPLARALLNASALDIFNEANSIASIFSSEDEMLKSVANVIQNTFTAYSASDIHNAMTW